MKHLTKTLAAAGIAAAVLATTPARADRGVTDDEVVIGSVSDLSGPFSAFGAPAMSAARMRFDEVNASGGIHGRTIRFVVEDSGYQMPKAMQAYNKLINRDNVFRDAALARDPDEHRRHEADGAEEHPET